jgi:hypothetical protein
MFDNASRSLLLEQQLWPSLREEFSNLKSLPAEALVQVGYPSSGARGRSSKIKPCEVNYQWTGNPNEKLMIAIHPVYFAGATKAECALNVAKALAFGALKVTGGARWGPQREGFAKENDGTITATPSAIKRLERVLAQCGELPDGFGLAFPVRQVEHGRLRKYIAVTGLKVSDGSECKHPVVRSASDTLHIACSECTQPFTLVK